MSQTHSITERLADLGHISVVVVRFGRCLKFCHLEFDKKAISDGFMAHSRVF